MTLKETIANIAYYENISRRGNSITENVNMMVGRTNPESVQRLSLVTQVLSVLPDLPDEVQQALDALDREIKDKQKLEWYDPITHPNILPWDDNTEIDGWSPCFWWKPGWSPSDGGEIPMQPPGMPVPMLQVPISDPISAGACPQFMSHDCLYCIRCKNNLIPSTESRCSRICRYCILIFRHEGRWWFYANGEWFFIDRWYSPMGQTGGYGVIPYVPGLGVPADCLDPYPQYTLPFGIPPTWDRVNFDPGWIDNPIGHPGLDTWLSANCYECEQLLGSSACGSSGGDPLIPTFPVKFSG